MPLKLEQRFASSITQRSKVVGSHNIIDASTVKQAPFDITERRQLARRLLPLTVDAQNRLPRHAGIENSRALVITSGGEKVHVRAGCLDAASRAEPSRAKVSIAVVRA